jgi:hypothetical protein
MLFAKLNIGILQSHIDFLRVNIHFLQPDPDILSKGALRGGNQPRDSASWPFTIDHWSLFRPSQRLVFRLPSSVSGLTSSVFRLTSPVSLLPSSVSLLPSSIFHLPSYHLGFIRALTHIALSQPSRLSNGDAASPLLDNLSAAVPGGEDCPVSSVVVPGNIQYRTSNIQ